jgi:hypothetical protein
MFEKSQSTKVFANDDAAKLCEIINIYFYSVAVDESNTQINMPIL